MKIIETFKSLKYESKLSSLTILLGVFSLFLAIISASIGYLGYSISHSVELRNQHENKIQNANHLKSFWKDIAIVEENIASQVEIIGSNAGNFQVAYFETLNEIGSLNEHNNPKTLNPNNPKLVASFFKLISTYAKLQASVETIAVKYDNSVLTYSPLVEALNIKGWDKYLNVAKEIRGWKLDSLKIYHQAYIFVYSFTKNNKAPSDIESEIKKIGFEFGKNTKIFTPPILSGINAIKNANYPQHNNTLKKETP